MIVNFRIAFIFLIFTSLTCGKKSDGNGIVPSPSTNTFTNPLLSSGPDPWVVRKNEFYYYTHTLSNRIAVWKTQKMSELKDATVQTIWSPPSTGPNSKNIWAP
jgi:hypothetical protein